MGDQVSAPTGPGNGQGGSAALTELDGITRSVGRRGEILALKDVTCSIRAGEFVAVVGSSGSGKTTLLSILGLLDRPTSGRYLLGGTDVAGLDECSRNEVRGRDLGFVFQNAYLIGAESAADNVALGLRVRGVPARERESLVRDVLERVGLARSADQRAGELSGGEKQRVAVARALVGAPRVILADEPTGALDTASTENLIELLAGINGSGTTVVVVTHDPLVAGAAGRVIEIVDGVIGSHISAPKAQS